MPASRTVVDTTHKQLLDDILRASFDAKASDIHIVTDHPPLYRVHTTLGPAPGDWPVITAEMAMGFVKAMVDKPRVDHLEQLRDADFSYEVEGLSRFRVNAHFQRETIAIAFRAISTSIPDLSTLGLPPVVQNFIHLPRGLILVTGQTGSGKSTTLASMIEAMNQQYPYHVITCEDPVEYELRSKSCVIEQRELGTDVPTFASGLKHALRQDPDVILVGEMRDLETTSAAITAAETGHLVLSTLHTQNASQTIERIIDIYPGEQQNQIRAMLANTLQAVVSQVLFRRQDKPGMVPAVEVMICNPALRNCIRENRIHEIPNIIETNRQKGMNTLDDSIRYLCVSGIITPEQAVSQAANPQALRQALAAPPQPVQ